MKFRKVFGPSFHVFPNANTRGPQRAAWIRSLKKVVDEAPASVKRTKSGYVALGNTEKWQPSPYAVVCGRHFIEGTE